MKEKIPSCIMEENQKFQAGDEIAMELFPLCRADLSEVMELFVRCFSNDHYYTKLIPDPQKRKETMRTRFSQDIGYCLEQGFSWGERDASGKLAAFIIVLDYKKTKANDAQVFARIFGGEVVDGEIRLPYGERFHNKVNKISERVLFLLSVAVRPDCRRQGMASKLVDWIIETYPDYSLAGDVSNEESLPIYQKRGFRIQPIDDGYFLVIRRRIQKITQFDFSGDISLVIPDTQVLDLLKLSYHVKKENLPVQGYNIREGKSCRSFVREHGGQCMGMMVTLSYDNLLAYQRYLNLSLYVEEVYEDGLIYVQDFPYEGEGLFNDTLCEMLSNRQKEWAVIPDIFIAIPVQYTEKSMLAGANAPYDLVSDSLLRDLDFRTHFEAGVPSDLDEVDELSGFKKRICRYYLGKFQIKITQEMTVDCYDEAGLSIGQPAWVDVIIAVDNNSRCGVLTLYSLSAPFLISHLMDNVIRNQLFLRDGQEWKNLFDYLKKRFGLVKRGSAKMFVTIPQDRSCLSNSQIASLLAAETIYPDGEELGGIIDEEILAPIRSNVGMGQYDRAFVCAYTNVLLQFCPDFCACIRDRLCEEAITLFYIELILFEEAAIHIADSEIIATFNMHEDFSPVEFLQQVDAIYDSYSKTIDFWDIQVNYPTSQKSIHMLRKAFQIHEQLEYMKRNQEQLQTVFDTKCDLIDRKESRRMDMSLAILSILAVFSAWIDGYDYLDTWRDTFAPGTIHILQKLLFLFILIVAGYAVTHLFSNRIHLFIRIRRLRSRRKKHRKR